jgi:hypothetical protein
LVFTPIIALAFGVIFAGVNAKFQRKPLSAVAWVVLMAFVAVILVPVVFVMSNINELKLGFFFGNTLQGEVPPQVMVAGVGLFTIRMCLKERAIPRANPNPAQPPREAEHEEPIQGGWGGVLVLLAITISTGMGLAYVFWNKPPGDRENIAPGILLAVALFFWSSIIWWYWLKALPRRPS